MNDNLSTEELQYMFDHCYSIRVNWLSPVEGYQYIVFRMGQDKPLAFRRSQRTAFTFIRRLVEKKTKEPKLQRKQKAK